MDYCLEPDYFLFFMLQTDYFLFFMLQPDYFFLNFGSRNIFFENRDIPHPIKWSVLNVLVIILHTYFLCPSNSIRFITFFFKNYIFTYLAKWSSHVTQVISKLLHSNNVFLVPCRIWSIWCQVNSCYFMGVSIKWYCFDVILTWSV